MWICSIYASAAMYLRESVFWFALGCAVGMGAGVGGEDC